MSKAVDRFVEAARVEGLHPEVHRFPEGTKTAVDAARAIGCDVAQIVKSLIFMADGVPVLVLTSGANRVNTAALATACRARDVHRASPGEAREATGFAVGGTPPFGHSSRVRTFIDEDLLRLEEVWAAAGTPDSVFPLRSLELLRVSGATPAALAERA